MTTDEHRQQAGRELPAQDAAWLLVYDFEMTDCRCDGITLTAGAKANLEQRIASALAARDAKIREVLEGLLDFCDRVIETWEITPILSHRAALQRAREFLKSNPKNER